MLVFNGLKCKSCHVATSLQDHLGFVFLAEKTREGTLHNFWCGCGLVLQTGDPFSDQNMFSFGTLFQTCL